MDSEQMARMQLQLRHNAEDLQSFLSGLDSWESEIKEKDESLRRQKPILKEKFPPIRGQRSATSAVTKKKRRRREKAENEAGKQDKKPARISSYNYTAWDRFDVEKACEEVDYKVQSSSGSEGEWEGEEEREGSSEEWEEEALEEERRRQQAVMEKEKGNLLFKEGQYELAVESYTRAMELDPLTAILPANRAMALLKLERYAAAESDCCMALVLDDSYVKAYLRRGTARAKLGKLAEAREDFQEVLRLEPGSKQARTEAARIDKELKAKENSPAQPSLYVSAVKRPPHLRSKKPMKRILIEDVGGEEEQETASGAVSTQTSSQTTTPPAAKSVSVEELPSDVSNSKLAHPVQEQQMESGNSEPVEQIASMGASESSGRATGSGILATRDESREELKLPPVPETSLQFQTEWKHLRRDQTTLSLYFKSIPPSKYPVLLQQSLETDVFPEVISILHKEFIRCGKPCLEELRWLTKVKRFSVAVMFLSRKEKEGLCQLFKDLQGLIATDSDQTELKRLAAEFSVKL